ncbi:MAG: sigma 54-interacting transcriptional regulator [Treponema sp.]|nr:sigma 54-interacting transcriptional regulator [Treponema sp.]
MAEFVSSSKRMQRLLAALDAVASSPAPVLIRGERGSGKEYLARKIHEKRALHGPFVTVKCLAFDRSCISNVIPNSTLFLDGVQELGAGGQADLHAFLSNGGQADRVKVVASVSGDVDLLVSKGLFRRDLLVMLDLISVSCPPLRERPEDVVPLALHFLKEFSREMGRDVRGFSPAVLHRLESYHWPGNLRELKNVIEGAVLRSRGCRLENADVVLAAGSPSSGEGAASMGIASGLELKEAVDLFKKSYIEGAIGLCAGNKAEAARSLGIQRTYLFKLIKDLGVDVPDIPG